MLGSGKISYVRPRVEEVKENNKLPEDRTAVGGKWVYQVKLGPNNEDRFKARYVAKGYSQVKDLDYDETFTPTAKMPTLRTMLSVSVEKNVSSSNGC